MALVALILWLSWMTRSSSRLFRSSCSGRRSSLTRPHLLHHGTQPKKNKGAGKSKDTSATGTPYSPRKRQVDLARIAWPCSPRKQKSSLSRKRSAGISKTAYDPLGTQARRAAELHTAYADQRMAQQINLAPYRIWTGYDEDVDSI
jgi:hypothetical protein